MDEIFKFRIEKVNDPVEKKSFIGLTTIIDIDQNLAYMVPVNLQEEAIHAELFKIPAIQSARKRLLKIGDSWSVKVKITKNLFKIYFDDSENLMVGNELLEEFDLSTITMQQTNQIDEAVESNLMKKIKDLEEKISKKKKIDLSDVERKFVIVKFDGSGDANEFIATFERECNRFEIISDEEMVQVLRFFVTNTAEKWYQSKIKKLERTDWSVWRASFISVFGKKSWSTIKGAISFRYMTGAYLDYMLTKENMLLDIQSDLQETTLVNLIVIGLPLEIQTKLDRDVVTTMDKLFEEVSKLESNNKKEKFSMNRNQRRMPDKPTEKKPCGHCKSLGFENNYHPEVLCRNKERADRMRTQRKVNCIEENKEDEEEEIYKILNINNDSSKN